MELGSFALETLGAKQPGVSTSRCERAGKHLRISLSAAALSLVAMSSHAAGLIFHDDFESYPLGTLPTTNWANADICNLPQVVSVSADGIAAPHSGTKMLRSNSNGTLAWNDPARFESAKLDTSNYRSELFIRIWIRLDANHDISDRSPGKILRMFNQGSLDLVENMYPKPGLVNIAVVSGTILNTYWGGNAGDDSTATTKWHKIEYYFNDAQGRIRIWHDGILVRDEVGLSFNGAKWSPLFVVSNWSDAHDATNYVYFDDVEVYSDVGTGATGLMSDATITTSGTSTARLPAPTNLRVNAVTQ